MLFDREAIARRGDVKIDVCAVLNDTTGCLMSCAWKVIHHHMVSEIPTAGGTSLYLVQ